MTPNAKMLLLCLLRCKYKKNAAAKVKLGIKYLIIIQFSPVIIQTPVMIQEISGGLKGLDKGSFESQLLAFRR